MKIGNTPQAPRRARDQHVREREREGQREPKRNGEREREGEQERGCGEQPCAARIESPIGTITLRAVPEGLKAVEFGANAVQGTATGGPAARILDEASRQLGEYFAGKRRDFSLPLAIEGTAFERSVWAALRAIPYGQTMSYGDLAARLGRPRAARAVGGASGRNRLPIIIPCHRLIGCRGELTGFGGGLEAKRRLLKLEGAVLL
jgi:methylated-DNA-[protein]-cysteine S-methyltransferase